MNNVGSFGDLSKASSVGTFTVAIIDHSSSKNFIERMGIYRMFQEKNVVCFYAWLELGREQD
jgi:hypothetical protein